eukprot:12234638-Alexandrium_andersonii.AAC.1
MLPDKTSLWGTALTLGSVQHLQCLAVPENKQMLRFPAVSGNLFEPVPQPPMQVVSGRSACAQARHQRRAQRRARCCGPASGDPRRKERRRTTHHLGPYASNDRSGRVGTSEV